MKNLLSLILTLTGHHEEGIAMLTCSKIDKGIGKYDTLGGL